MYPPYGYTLLVAGARSGKTSFLRLLLDTTQISPTATPEQIAAVARFVQTSAAFTSHIRCVTIDVELEDSRRVRLTLIDAPALTEVDELLRYAETGFADSDPDSHIHLCLYFLDPDHILPPSVPGPVAPVIQRIQRNGSFSHPPEPLILEPPVATKPSPPNLPSAEIAAIRRLSARLNVLPVIARADTLSNDRLSAVKMAVRKDLADAGIGFGIFDHTSDSLQLAPMSGERDNSPKSGSTSPVIPFMLRLPYALISPDIYSHSDGVARFPPSRHELMNQYSPSCQKPTVGRFIRQYRWGSVDVLDPAHTDFQALKGAIFQHMEALQNYTREYLCKRYLMENNLQPIPYSNVPKPILTVDTTSVVGHAPPPAPSINGILPPTQISDPKSRSSNISEPAATRTKKITVACNFCRSRKLKCDGGRPACAQCEKRSHRCDYQLDRRRRGARLGTKKEDDSELSVEDSPEGEEEPDRSLSPELQPLRQLPLMGSGMEGARLPPLPSVNQFRRMSGDSSPSLPPPSSGFSYMDTLPPSRFGNEQDLPHITSIVTTAPPSASIPPAPLSASILPPIRDSRESESLTVPQPQRKRAATTPNGKSTRSMSASGPKVVACNHCRNRKTKCDGAHPACSSCVRRSVVCEYATEPTTRKPRKPSVKKLPQDFGPGGHPPPESLYSTTNTDESPPTKKMRLEMVVP